MRLLFAVCGGEQRAFVPAVLDYPKAVKAAKVTLAGKENVNRQGNEPVDDGHYQLFGEPLVYTGPLAARLTLV